jgi:hypothetical protein
MFPEFRPGMICAFTGLPGSGKTGLMSYIASIANRSGWRVVSNYTLSCADDRVTKVSQLQQRNTLICIDELQLIAGSRNFAKAVNMTISEWLELDIRKPGNMLFYTAQDFNMVDINARRLTTYIYDSEIVHTGVSVLSKIQNMRYDRYVLRGRFKLSHSVFYGLYDTYDRNVRLSTEGVRA